MAGRALRDARREDSAAYGVLDYGFMQVVAALLSRLALDVGARGGKDPLPGPLAAGGRELLRQRPGKLDPPGTVYEVALVLGPHAPEVRGKLGLNEQRRERLVLRRGRDVSAGRQSIPKDRDVLRAEFGWIAPAVELVVAAHPAEVGLLSARPEVAQAHSFQRALGQTRSRSREQAVRLAQPLAHERSSAEPVPPVVRSPHRDRTRSQARLPCGGAGPRQLAREHQRHLLRVPPTARFGGLNATATTIPLGKTMTCAGSRRDSIQGVDGVLQSISEM